MNIEQLEIQVQKTEEIKTRLGLYIKLITELQKSDLPHAIQVCEEAIAIARQSCEDQDCQEELANCIFHLGMLNARNGNYVKAISIIYDDIPLIEKTGNRYLLARAINVIAASNGYLANYYEALNQFMKTLEIFKEIGNQQWEAGVLNNIGYQYWHLGNYDWALKYLNMSLEKVETIKDKTLEGDVCETLCNVFLSKGDFDQALHFGLRSITLYREVGDKHGEAEILNSIGDVYKAREQYEKALECFQQALQLSREIGHQHEEVETLLRLGEYFSHAAQTEKALEMLKRALVIAEKLGVKRTIYECHQALSKVNKQVGDFENALAHYEKFYEMYREVFDGRETNRIESIENMRQAETARKDAEIFRLKNVALQSEIDERKKAQDALNKLAVTDPLTNLFNRRYFFELAEKEFQRARVVNSQISIILIDIDNFKRVNDQYGHAVGDETLVKLSKIMQDSVRKGDILARYGGEEFVMLLPDSELEQAQYVSERLRGTVKSQKISVGGHDISLSISTGIACFANQPDVTLETLINRADLSMYEAKQAGGNRVQIWRSGEP